MLFVKWVIVKVTRNCSELSGLNKILQEISSLLMLRIGKLSTVVYICIATLLLSVHATQMQQAVEEERE
jgi:hypothetical protein